MRTGKDLSFEAFRGVAIIAVVAIHAGAFSFLEGQLPSDVWKVYTLVAYFQLLFFAVPAFIFMAGYWSSKKPVSSIKDYKAFLVRKLPRILIPYLFWSLVIFGWQAVRTRDLNLYGTMWGLLIGGACFPYYFIIVIAQLYLITPILQYINRRSYGLTLVFALNTVALLFLYLSRVYHVIGHLPAYLPFYSWVIFYELGLWVGNSSDRMFVPPNKRGLVLLALLIALLLSVAEGIVLLSQYNNLNSALTPIKYSSFLYSGCVVLSFLTVRVFIKNWPRILVAVGNYSYGIYLIHIFILRRVVEIVSRIDMVWSFSPLCQLVIILATVAACFVLISITRKLLPEVFCRKVLGF
jgi:surface polysaccharide O-acyltransferase-like enzyme